MTTIAEYAAILAVNWSTLRAILVSPRHYRHALANPPAETPAMRLGSMAHCAILEPDIFDSRYLSLRTDQIAEIAPPRNTRDGKAAWAEYVEAHPGQGEVDSEEYRRLLLASALPGRVIISAPDRAQCLAMRDAVHGHASARQYVTGAGSNEHTLTWIDRRTGIECKGRADRLSESPRALLDLKTARTINARRFGGAAYEFGYHRQMAFYSNGLDEPRPVFLLAVESVAPYDVALIPVEEEALEVGHADVRLALDRLAECRASGVWPGQYPGIAPGLQLPAYAFPEGDIADLGLDFNEESEG